MQPQISPDGYWMWNGAQWVPNPYRPVAAPPLAPSYESARFRSQMTAASLAANAFGLLLLIAFDITDVIYSQTANPGDGLTLADGLIDLAAVIVFYSTYIAAIVFFCMWLHRVVRNMPALGSPDPRWSPARSVVYCFVPILNFVQPLLSVHDAWRGADPGRRWLDAGARKATRASVLVGGWWTLWLVGGLLSRIAFRMNGAPGDKVDLVSNILLIGAAVLAILVVRELTDRQDLKQALIASGRLV